MKKKDAIQEIRIDFNCPIKWDSMEKNGQNRNCQTCNKTVIDFSLLSDEEVLAFFKNRNEQRTCGKFEKTQLANLNLGLNNKSYLQRGFKSIVKPLIVAAAISSIAACSSTKNTVQCNSKTPLSKVEIVKEGTNPDSLNTILLQGKIVSEDGLPLIGATFRIDESNEGVSADVNGNFELRIPKETVQSENVNISYAGYESISLKLDDIKNRKINVVMGDYVIVGEVVIKRSLFKRRFNNHH